MSNALPVEVPQAEDIANAVFWLVSDAARYATGVAPSRWTPGRQQALDHAGGIAATSCGCRGPNRGVAPFGVVGGADAALARSRCGGGIHSVRLSLLPLSAVQPVEVSSTRRLSRGQARVRSVMSVVLPCRWGVRSAGDLGAIGRASQLVWCSPTRGRPG